MPESKYIAFCAMTWSITVVSDSHARTMGAVANHARTHLARERGMEGPGANARIDITI